jgi:Peptidase_C39 like family
MVALVCRLALLAALLLGSGNARAEVTNHSLKLDIDPLLALPALFLLTPDSLEKLFTADGFEASPYIRWTKEGKTRALFTRQPFKNIQVSLTMQGGKVPVDSAVLNFAGGKATTLTVTLSRPEGDLEAGPLAAKRQECASLLSKLLETQPVTRPRFFGFKHEKAVSAETWTSPAAVACLDFGESARILRFTIATYTTDVATLVARPLPATSGGSDEFFVNVDALVAAPAVWALTPEKLEQTFAPGSFKETPYFKWLTADRSGARFSKHPYSNVSIELSMFNGQVPVDEVVLDFKNGVASQVSLSLFNRGDSGNISKQDFDNRYKTAGVTLNQWLGVKPQERRPTAQTAVKTTGWLWTSPKMLALLEYNTDALVKPGAAEFMRLKFSPPSGKDQLLNIAAIGRDSTGLKRSELPKFVKKDNGDVFVSGVPMVDQGDKGYCVVASAQRLFGYLRIPCDQHEIAALAGSDAQRGTSSKAMEETLAKIVNRFKARFKPLLLKAPRRSTADKNARPDRFVKMIAEHVDKGEPLLWGLELGLHPEEPPLRIQGTGGHMRLILGYNTEKNQILFSDSWGAGHELKRMNLEHAIDSTFGIYLLEPRDFY